MYHAIVRRRAARVFEQLSRGEWQESLEDVAPDVHHIFPGDHALGGERHSREAMGRWFERLFRLFPGLKFEVHDVAARGWPWNTVVAVQWTDWTTPASGDAYRNDGAHWIRLRWGKATEIHAYLDSQLVADACREMAKQGVDEAAAAPIVD